MIPIHFIFVPPRLGLSVASLVKAHQLRHPHGYYFNDSENIHDYFSEDGDRQTPLTDLETYGDRYALCECTFEKLDENERVVDRLTMNDVVVGVKLKKQIVSTNVVGMKGSVKEYTTRDDSEITFTVGVMAVENGQIVDQYPLEGVRELRAFFEDNTTVAVHSDFLEAMQIDRIVFTEFEAKQTTESNYQTISLTALEETRYNAKATDY